MDVGLFYKVCLGDVGHRCRYRECLFLHMRGCKELPTFGCLDDVNWKNCL